MKPSTKEVEVVGRRRYQWRQAELLTLWPATPRPHEALPFAMDLLRFLSMTAPLFMGECIVLNSATYHVSVPSKAVCRCQRFGEYTVFIFRAEMALLQYCGDNSRSHLFIPNDISLFSASQRTVGPGSTSAWRPRFE
ncbi:uncharacterized protein LOC110828488 [Zootermopsis nevadensis]|uniref:uncharacterized protein LOC110828488 n=1 Tax=Zootermopsis nevadensis TaxID=136037 RepID=UPI000B8E8949|nr:uncharacterized protein LOC110828488 [Zootermopsis nevadensis]